MKSPIELQCTPVGGVNMEDMNATGRHDSDLDTFYLVLDHGTPDERIEDRGRAAVALFTRLGGVWKIAALGRLIPRPLLDGLYRLVARTRYQVFGKHEACMLPAPGFR